MNAGMFFQTMGGNLVAGTSLKTLSTQTVNSFGSAGESFQKELGKVFDGTKSSAKETKNDNADRSNPVSERKDAKTETRDDSDKGNVQETKDDRVIINEEQAAGTVQLQQPVQIDAEQLVVTGVETVIGQTVEEEGMSLIDVQPEEVFDIKGKELLITKDGKLTAQSSTDMVKADMLRAATAEAADDVKIKAEPDINRNVQIETAEKADEVVKTIQTAAESESGLQQGTGEEQNEQFDGEVAPFKANTLDPGKINVKVADAPVDTTRADAAQQMADKIVYKLSQGKHEFDMELNPASLGKVNIKMVFENGSAEIIMTTSNAKAHQLLSAHTDALKAILEGTLGMNNNVEVKQAENTSEQFDRDNFQEQSERQQGQQQRRRESEQDSSFVERLRLGLAGRTEDFEWEAV